MATSVSEEATGSMWQKRGEREEARKRFLHELSLELYRLDRIKNLQFCLELLERFLSEVEEVSAGYDVLDQRFPTYITGSSDVLRFFRSTMEKIQEFAPVSEVERAWLLGTFVRESVFPAAMGFLPSILKEDDEHPERSVLVSLAS